MTCPAPPFAPARDSILTDKVLVLRVLPSRIDLHDKCSSDLPQPFWAAALNLDTLTEALLSATRQLT